MISQMKLLTFLLMGPSLCILFVLVGCDPSTGAETQKDAKTRPNILLIMPDDMGYTDLGAFGSEIRTPNLDALALGGVRFTNFHAGPACESSRAMLLTGTYNRIVGVVDDSRNPGSLNAKALTLPRLLQDAGYHTVMAGKWHIGRGEEQSAAAHGFESSFALMKGATGHFADLGPAENPPFAAVYRENGKLVALPKDFYSTRFYADKIIEYLKANEGDGAPFFAWYTPTVPHWPLQVPEAYLDRYAGAYDSGYENLIEGRIQRADKMGVLPDGFNLKNYPRSGPLWSELSEQERRLQSRRMELYAAMMENFDYHVGRILDYLKESDQFKNTRIVFISDNGGDVARRDHLPWVRQNMDNSLENLGRKNSFVAIGGWGDATTAPFKRNKMTAFEGGIRVSAFAFHPSFANKGGTSDEFLTIMDVMPTFLDLASVVHPGHAYKGREVAAMRGGSFSRLLLAGDGAPIHSGDEAIGWSSFALIKGGWKLVRLRSRGAQWELYHLAKDPSETTDLSRTHPKVFADLLSEWNRFAEETGTDY